MKVDQPGHVFVVHGDITVMAVDAWILPTDRRCRIRPHWKIPGSTERANLDKFSPGFRAGEIYAEELPWAVSAEARPVATAVPEFGVVGPADIRRRLSAGLAVAAGLGKDRVTKAQVERVPRVATPTFGRMGGGGGAIAGALLQTYFDVALECAEQYGVDVIIACASRVSFHSLQILRTSDVNRFWPALDSDRREEARRLADAARSGDLVPFIGSGASVSSGLPVWKELLERLRLEALKANAGIASEVSKERFEALPLLDQAELLQMDLGEEMKKTIASATTSGMIGLPPLLLASLPSREAVTLNYDTLFEEARRFQQTPPVVIPHGSVEAGRSWLLKLHGSTSAPDDIVLTREDYLGYAQSRSALSSMAVALLMTRHLLFVGFGFTDDHFHRLLHEVRSVRDRMDPTVQKRTPVGTALVLGRDPVFDRLWGDQVRVVRFDDGPDSSSKGRQLEIFLDLLVALAVESPTYLLRPEYDGMLTDDERDLAHGFAALMDRLPLRNNVRPSVLRAFADLEAALGADGDPESDGPTKSGSVPPSGGRSPAPRWSGPPAR